MIKKTVIAAAVATAGFVATPALAQDMSGARVGVEIGMLDDDLLGSQDSTYGVNAGYDFDLGNMVAGPVVTYTGVFDDDFDTRELSVGGRLGAKIGNGSLFYGTIAYTSVDADDFYESIEGVKYGLGFEKDFGGFYGTIETRYADYEYGVEAYQTVVGAGFKF